MALKQIKMKAELILNITSGGSLVAEKDEDEIILEIEQKLNSLQPFELSSPASSFLKVGVRVHIKERL